MTDWVNKIIIFCTFLGLRGRDRGRGDGLRTGDGVGVYMAAQRGGG